MTNAALPVSSDRASRGGWLSEIAARRDLLYMLTWREIRVKYKQSVMGALWAVLMPLLIVSAGIVVKYVFASLSGTPVTKYDIVSVAVRSVPWAFFVAGIRFGSMSLVSHANLVTKISMPRVLFPIASILGQLLDLAIAGAVLSVLVLVNGIPVTVQVLWVPVLLGILIVLTAGLAILLSAAALFFRDVKYIVEVLITFAIFFTPVVYEARLLGRWQHWLMLNPVAPLLEGMSAAVLGQPMPSAAWLLYSASGALAVLGLALTFFRRTEPYFAESI